MNIDNNTDPSPSQQDTLLLQRVPETPQPKLPKKQRKPQKTRLERLPLNETRTTAVVRATTALMRAIKKVPVERLPEYFEQTCDWRQQDTAVICGSSQLTYQELDQQANRLAHFLISHGIGKGSSVGILLERSLDSYIALLGILKAGAAFVPIDPLLHSDWLDFIVKDAGLRALVTTSAFREKTSPLPCRVLELDQRQDVLSVQNETRPQVRVNPASLCYIAYTPGTTDQPIGVAVSHANIVNLFRVITPIYGIRHSDRVYQGMSTAFDYSLEEIWSAWIAGATLVAGPTDSQYFGRELAAFLTHHKITVLRCSPTLLATIDSDVPSVRTLLIGVGPCSTDLVSKWARPGRRILNTYGPTETTITATWCELFPARPITIGSPLPTYYVSILDEQHHPVKDGKSGEIYIGGSGITIGYVNRPDLMKERFIPNPNPHEQETIPYLYRTGDLGRITPAGEIEYLGHIGTQQKLRSYRIELDEIEQMLYTASAAIKIAGVRANPKHEAETPRSKILKQLNIKNIYKNIMTDPLYRNSIFNMASTLILGALGFAFWIIIARLYKPEDVGIATTLISIMTLLSSITTLGLNVSLNRYLPKSTNKSELINSSFGIVTLATLLASAIFLLGLQTFSPQLVFLRSNFFYMISFTVFVIFYSWNILVESVCMAFRAAGNILLKNTTISILKLVLPFVLITFGAFGIFAANSAAFGIGVVLVLVMIIINFKIKPAISIDISFVKKTAIYSFANYISSFMSSMPSLVLPIIILNVLSAKYAAYYYIASMIQSILQIVPTATAQALLTEGAYNEGALKKHVKKATVTIFIILIPTTAAIIFAGNIILEFIGKSYADEAFQFLQLYSGSTIFTALILIANAIMKVKHQMKSLVILNVASNALTLWLSYAFISGKLVGIGWGWMLGQAISGLVTIFFIVRNL